VYNNMVKRYHLRWNTIKNWINCNFK